MEMESSRRSIEGLRDSASLKKPRLAVDPDRPFQPKRQQQPPPPPLASRLRAARDDDPIRSSSAFQTQQSDIIAQYKAELADLTFNSKPIITNLTIIAGENLPAAKGIAATICANILEVPSEQKLPSLYLLDSVVKNIGRDYIKYFAARLPEVFCKAYRQVAASVHPAMRHLFGTWKGVFPLSTLQSLEKELGFQPAINGSSSAAATARPDSQAQRPAHSIHVNPKYLARQCLQQSNRAKEISGDDAGSTVTSAEDVEKPDRTSIIGSTRPWTDMPAKLPNIHRPQRDPLNEAVHAKNSGSGYADYEFVSDVPRHADLGPGIVNERIPERSGLEKSWYGAGNNAADTTLSQRNGFDFPDTYRNYRPSRLVQNTSQLPSTQHVSSSNSRVTPEIWKNSEEEEFIWDHMNSRFSDRGTNRSRKDDWDHDNEKPESLPRAKWMPSETEHLDTRWNTFDTARFDRSSRIEDRVPFQREAEDHLQQPRGWEEIRSRVSKDTSVDSLLRGQPPLTLFGYQTPPRWPTQEQPSMDGLNLRNIGSKTSSQTEALPTSASSGAGLSSSLARTGIQPHSESPPSGALPPNFGSGTGMLYQRQPPLRPASPAPLSGYQRPQSPSSSAPHNQQSEISVDNDHLQTNFSRPSQKSSQLLVQLNEASHVQAAQDTKPLLPPKHILPGSFPNRSLPSSQPPQHVQSSSTLATYTQAKHNMPFSQQSQSELSLQKTQSESSFLSQKSSQPSFVGDPHTATGYSGTGTNNPIADILGQSSTGSLLAAIMNSGLVSAKNHVTSSFTSPSFTDSSTPSHFSALPPLPSGPPPIPFPSSSLPMATPTSLARPSAHGSALGPAINAPKAVLPPLPPGPPPPLSHVGCSSQGSSTTATAHDPLSSLLSSLVAKGLISTPQKEVTTSSAPHASSNSSVPVSSVSSSSAIQSSSLDKELLNSLSRASETSLTPTSMVGTKGLIGIEFKPEIIRQLHQLVIDSLFNDLPHQCSMCGVRVRLQEELSRHIEWHDSKKHVEDGCDKVSRRWFASLSDWIAGDVGPSTGSFHVASAEGRVMLETVGPMVPADENQCICILCGELFEDFYSEDRDEWMYEGAVYMDISLGEGNLDCTDKSTTGGPIVHANCISTSSNDLELV